MDLGVVYSVVYGSCALGVVWALINYLRIAKIDVNTYLLANEMSNTYGNEKNKPETL